MNVMPPWKDWLNKVLNLLALKESLSNEEHRKFAMWFAKEYSPEKAAHEYRRWSDEKFFHGKRW